MTLDLFPAMNLLTFPAKRSARRRRKPTAAEVVAFPLARRIRTVQAVAAGLERRDGAARDAYWLASIQALRVQLTISGISDDVAIEEIRKFKSAVQRAIDTHRFGNEPNGKDGVA